MKKIRFSEHMKYRMLLRKIEKGLPEKVFYDAEERYIDNETKTSIAVKHLVYEGKERDFMLAYRETEKEIVFLTIHPLKEGQRDRRVKSGRWKRL